MFTEPQKHPRSVRTVVHGKFLRPRKISQHKIFLSLHTQRTIKNHCESHTSNAIFPASNEYQLRSTHKPTVHFALQPLKRCGWYCEHTSRERDITSLLTTQYCKHDTESARRFHRNNTQQAVHSNATSGRQQKLMVMLHVAYNSVD